MYSVLNTLLGYPYFYQKTLLHTLFGLFLKSSEAFSVSLMSSLEITGIELSHVSEQTPQVSELLNFERRGQELHKHL